MGELSLVRMGGVDVKTGVCTYISANKIGGIPIGKKNVVVYAYNTGTVTTVSGDYTLAAGRVDGITFAECTTALYHNYSGITYDQEAGTLTCSAYAFLSSINPTYYKMYYVAW